MPSKLKCWLFIISLCFQISCSTVPPDVFVFEDLPIHIATDPKTGHFILKGSPDCFEKIQELACGHGTRIISGEEIFIGEESDHLFNGKKWSELKMQSVIVPAIESYAPLKTYVENSCKRLNCSDQVDAFKIKVPSVLQPQPVLSESPSIP